MSKRELTQVAKELIAAKKRIENPENWCQGEYENHGRHCALGALGRTKDSAHHAPTDAMRSLSDACRVLYRNSCAHAVNDFIGHKAILKAFDHAIATEIQKANTS